MRASASSTVTSDRVRPPRSCLRTPTWWSAWAATWARWVTTSTCRALSEVGQRGTDGGGRGPAHAGVDLVEDHDRRPRADGQTQGEHGPGQLTPGGGPGQRLEVARRGWLPGGRSPGRRARLPRPAHWKRASGMASSRRRASTSAASSGAARRRASATCLLDLRPAAPGPRRSHPRDSATRRSSSAIAGQAPCRLIGVGDDVGQLRAVLALEVAEQLSPLADGGQALPGRPPRSRPPTRRSATRSATSPIWAPQPGLDGPPAARDRTGPATPGPAGRGRSRPRGRRGRSRLRPRRCRRSTAAASRSSSAASRSSSSASTMAAVGDLVELEAEEVGLPGPLRPYRLRAASTSSVRRGELAAARPRVGRGRRRRRRRAPDAGRRR